MEDGIMEHLPAIRLVYPFCYHKARLDCSNKINYKIDHPNIENSITNINRLANLMSNFDSTSRIFYRPLMGVLFKHWSLLEKHALSVCITYSRNIDLSSK
ncbi:hypothetical protein AVEN_52857-1 [Araneus ventricosus]|uniref:Uncharacterized protein n=1 Tax=Araneus ventricosus TaxID=182803 RepID=A0A4Y2N981_ARAVE|nr:hypothetical protein AVEN_52857-1 [Araneus ventricosus]